MMNTTYKVENIQSVSDIVYSNLRNMIFSQDLKNGDRLIESNIAEEMNVSRTPVREAIKKLEAEGLLEYKPRRGAIVKGISREDIIEIYSIRKAIEVLAVEYSVDNITSEELENLRELSNRSKKHAEAGETELFNKVLKEFNQLLIETSRKPRLIRLIDIHLDYLERFRLANRGQINRRKEAIEEHDEIIEAISKKDKEEARNAVINHLNNAQKAYLDVVLE